MSAFKSKITNMIDTLPYGSVFISNDFLDIASYETTSTHAVALSITIK